MTEPLGHALERIIERGLVNARARTGNHVGTYRLACEIADDLVAEIPLLQLAEIVADHPRAASIEIRTGTLDANARWYAAGDTSADDESGHGCAATLEGAIAVALEYGTPARPKT